MRRLVSLVVLAACRGNEAPPPTKQAPPPPPAADAAVAIDATIGPILDLVRCVPAPVMPGESTSKPAQIALGTATIAEGPGKGAVVGDVLRQRQNRLRYCYEQNLPRKPSLAGSAVLTVITQPTGYVHEAYVEPLVDDELVLCIKHIVSELQFPVQSKTDNTTTKVPLSFSWKGTPRDGDHVPAAWTPFAASSALVPTEDAIQAAVAVQKAMPTAQLATCLADQTGSLRAVLKVAADGSVADPRVGGFGDAKAEACMARALASLHVEPVPAASEVACDFVRGDVKPWRVAGDGGYTVINATGDKLVAPTVHAQDTALVLVTASTPAAMLAAALQEAAPAAAYLVGLRDGDRIDLVAGERHARVIADPAAPLVLDTREPLRICGGLLDEPHSAPAAEVDALLAQAARTCTARPCPTQLTIATGTHTAGELATYAAAARAAGFERIRLGTGTCPAKL